MAVARRPAARALLLLFASVFAACGPRADAPREVAVDIGSVAVDRVSGAPVVILVEASGERSLPIWIGFAEAQSIASEMEKRQLPRPNTHDLAKRLIDGLEGALERVVVTELRDGTYYAVIFLSVHGDLIEVDARPSDAIALALRCQAPVFVREVLFEEARQAPPPDRDEHST